MLKGLAITPPVVGRIAIGKVVERHGKRLPEKDDQFTLTTQVQTKEGWVPHPLNDKLPRDASSKLREIPVTLAFNDPDLNFRADYSCFDRQTGRPVCVGNGENCRRVTAKGLEHLPCPSPDACNFAQGSCKPYGRLNVVLGGEDLLGTFVFRTTSFNSIRTLTARLQYYRAVSGGVLASLPLALRLRGKSTTQSYRSAIYYVDLVPRSGSSLESCIQQGRETNEQRKALGFDQSALDAAAHLGFANGLFEDSEEEHAAVVEEFFPHETGGEATEDGGSDIVTEGHSRLGQKKVLERAPSESLKDKLLRKP